MELYIVVIIVSSSITFICATITLCVRYRRIKKENAMTDFYNSFRSL